MLLVQRPCLWWSSSACRVSWSSWCCSVECSASSGKPPAAVGGVYQLWGWAGAISHIFRIVGLTVKMQLISEENYCKCWICNSRCRKKWDTFTFIAHQVQNQVSWPWREGRGHLRIRDSRDSGTTDGKREEWGEKKGSGVALPHDLGRGDASGRYSILASAVACNAPTLACHCHCNCSPASSLSGRYCSLQRHIYCR